MEHLKQALFIFSELRDAQGEATVLSDLGCTYRCLGQYELAFEHLDQSLCKSRELGARSSEGTALGNVEAALGRAAVYGSADIAASNAKPGKDGMVDWTKTDQAPLMRHVESDGVLRRLSMKRSVSSLLAQRPDALSREMSTKSKHERVGSSGSVSVSGDAASEAAPAPKDAKQKKKNREKNKLLKKMSSLQLPAFVRYGEQRRFEEDDA